MAFHITTDLGEFFRKRTVRMYILPLVDDTNLHITTQHVDITTVYIYRLVEIMNWDSPK